MQIILTKEEYDKLVADARSVQDQVTEKVREANRRNVKAMGQVIRDITMTTAFTHKCDMVRGAPGGFRELIEWTMEHVRRAATNDWRVDHDLLDPDYMRGPEYGARQAASV